MASVKAIEEPPSLIDLRKRVEAMMLRVDISEAVVESLFGPKRGKTSSGDHPRGEEEATRTLRRPLGCVCCPALRSPGL